MKRLLFGFNALLFFNATSMVQVVKQTPAKTTDSKMKAVAPTAKIVSMSKATTVAPKPAAVSVVLKKMVHLISDITIQLIFP